MKFTQSHEWINTQGTQGTVGVSEYAQRELGDIVFVELPQVGKKVRKGQEIAVLESTKAAADIYSPVSGTITAVNQNLSDMPDLVNRSPEAEGWLFKIELSHLDETDLLLTADAYNKLVRR